MKQDCGDIRRLLDAWMDEALPGSDARRVARHIEGCPGCREEAESRRGIDDALCAEDRASDPGDAYFSVLGDRINARFDFTQASRQWAKPAERPPRRGLAIPRAWIPRLGFGIAGAAVATIAGLLVHGLSEQPMLAPMPGITDTVTEERPAERPIETPRSRMKTMVSPGGAGRPTGTPAGRTSPTTTAPSTGQPAGPPSPTPASPSDVHAVAPPPSSIADQLDNAPATQLSPTRVTESRPLAEPSAPLSESAQPAVAPDRKVSPDPPRSDFRGRGQEGETAAAAGDRSPAGEPLASTPSPAQPTPSAVDARPTPRRDAIRPGLVALPSAPSPVADDAPPDRPALLAFFAGFNEAGEARRISGIEAADASRMTEGTQATSVASGTPEKTEPEATPETRLAEPTEVTQEKREAEATKGTQETTNAEATKETQKMGGTGQTRRIVSAPQAVSVPEHEDFVAKMRLADSAHNGLRRGEVRVWADAIPIPSPGGGPNTVADSTWIRLRREEARALADSALAAGTLEGCERALRAYWAMLHRDGRPLLPDSDARATALGPDRPRIALLLRCASR